MRKKVASTFREMLRRCAAAAFHLDHGLRGNVEWCRLPVTSERLRFTFEFGRNCAEKFCIKIQLVRLNYVTDVEIASCFGGLSMRNAFRIVCMCGVEKKTNGRAVVHMHAVTCRHHRRLNDSCRRLIRFISMQVFTSKEKETCFAADENELEPSTTIVRIE